MKILIDGAGIWLETRNSRYVPYQSGSSHTTAGHCLNPLKGFVLNLHGFDLGSMKLASIDFDCSDSAFSTSFFPSWLSVGSGFVASKSGPGFGFLRSRDRAS